MASGCFWWHLNPSAKRSHSQVAGAATRLSHCSRHDDCCVWKEAAVSGRVRVRVRIRVRACLLARAAASTRLATLPEAGACRGAVAVGQWCLLPSVSRCSKATGGRKLAPLHSLQAIGWLHFLPTASSSSSIGGQRVGVCNFVRAVLALHMTHDTTTNQAKTRSTYKSTRVHKTRRGHYFIGFVW